MFCNFGHKKQISSFHILKNKKLFNTTFQTLQADIPDSTINPTTSRQWMWKKLLVCCCQYKGGKYMKFGKDDRSTPSHFFFFLPFWMMVWDLENLPWIAVMCKGVFPSLLCKRKKKKKKHLLMSSKSNPSGLTSTPAFKFCLCNSERWMLAVKSQHDTKNSTKEVLLITPSAPSDNSMMPFHPQLCFYDNRSQGDDDRTTSLCPTLPPPKSKITQCFFT